RRKENRMSHTDDDACASSTTPEPGAALEERETLAHVLASLRKLPEDQQEVLELKFRHGLAYREISRVTGLTASNVGYLIHVGIKALRARHASGQCEPRWVPGLAQPER
ncbi:MAG: sigma-70 family RNA polymerase sigma factor, partial [bacterium]|nr:sigma-70 family RNA polymerase sigma factor [bacterium]